MRDAIRDLWRLLDDLTAADIAIVQNNLTKES